jgi:hypothetical protein
MRIFDSLVTLFRKPPPRTVTQPPPRSTIRPRDIVLRDAAYLVRRYLAGLPVSRRQSGLPERAWKKAIALCRSAEILSPQGDELVWWVSSYEDALASLQHAHRRRADRRRDGSYVDAYDD